MLFTGLTMIAMGLTAPDFELVARIFSVIFGLLFLFPMAFFGYEFFMEWRVRWLERKSEMTAKVPLEFEDKSIGGVVDGFRNSYAEFFAQRADQ